MYKFKIIVFDSNIKRFATLTHMIGPRQSNNGCLPARETEDPLAAKFEGLEALEQEGPVRPPSEDENLEALCGVTAVITFKGCRRWSLVSKGHGSQNKCTLSGSVTGALLFSLCSIWAPV